MQIFQEKQNKTKLEEDSMASNPVASPGPQPILELQVAMGKKE